MTARDAQTTVGPEVRPGNAEGSGSARSTVTSRRRSASAIGKARSSCGMWK